MLIEEKKLKAKDIAYVTTLMNPSGNEPAPVKFEADGEIGKLVITLDWNVETDDARWSVQLKSHDEPNLRKRKRKPA